MKHLVRVLALLGIMGISGAALAQADPIRIGFFAPLTGPAAADGESALNGAEVAVMALNEAGGVLGRPIELVVYDDAFSPDEAANVTRRLIEQDDVVAVISGSYSFTTRAGAPIAQQNGVPFVAAYAVHPSITGVGEYVFRMGTLATTQGAAGADLVANRLGLMRAAVLIVDNDFGTSLAESFIRHYERLGGEVVMQEMYPLGEADFRPLISGIRRADPDVIYAIGYFNEASSFVRQLRESGIDTQVIGQEGFDSPTFLELAGDTAEGVIITTELNRDSERAVVQDFLAAYLEHAGQPADAVSATSHDAVLLVAEAIRLAGSTDPVAMIEAMAGITDFQAVSGPIHEFSDTRDAVRPVAIQIVEGGEFHFFDEIDERELELE
ncbi:MAG TPA: ABC transporter substrate-binding protein [Trueperaceae bacterium]|nr:ABC transporter substrate-binding protein [Trueperaceae bacterium]